MFPFFVLTLCPNQICPTIKRHFTIYLYKLRNVCQFLTFMCNKKPSNCSDFDGLQALSLLSFLFCKPTQGSRSGRTLRASTISTKRSLHIYLHIIIIEINKLPFLPSSVFKYSSYSFKMDFINESLFNLAIFNTFGKIVGHLVNNKFLLWGNKVEKSMENNVNPNGSLKAGKCRMYV